MAALSPDTNTRNSSDTHEFIFIGAGYAVLTAAGELMLARANVLVFEARDRIGG